LRFFRGVKNGHLFIIPEKSKFSIIIKKGGKFGSELFNVHFNFGSLFQVYTG